VNRFSVYYSFCVYIFLRIAVFYCADELVFQYIVMASSSKEGLKSSNISGISENKEFVEELADSDESKL
jgi:hypothetical protein